MATQYIYLLQEREFIKTMENIYKVGRTKKENHQRFNQYPKGSILLFQMICNNCDNIECLIIKQFKERFTQRKDIGNEYFEGDYHSMIDMIYSTIKNECVETSASDHIKNDITVLFKDSDYICDCYEDVDNNDDVQRKKQAYLEHKIQLEFPDYTLSNHKTYFKIKKRNDEYVIVYVNPNLNYSNRLTFGECIDEHIVNTNVADKLDYFNSLIKTNVLILDKIYDLNSDKFVNKINKTKIHIEFDDYDYTELRDFHFSKLEDGDIFENSIRNIFYCNLIINDDLYCTSVKEYDKHNSFKHVLKITKDNHSFDNFSVDIGTNRYIIVTIYKINTEYYEYKSCLRKYIPYLIRWDSNHNYYLLNRDYEYIGTSLKRIEDDTTTNQLYLFNDGTKPWESKEDYINMCIKYHKTIKENGLLNCKTNNYTAKKLISLFD